MKFKFTCAFIIIGFCGCAEKTTLEEILAAGSKNFKEVLHKPEHEVQIIYGEIVGNSIVNHHLNVNANQFFYPASTVKMLAAFAAVERLMKDGMSLQTKIKIDSQKYHPVSLSYDSLFKDSIRIDNLLKKIFVFSDNQAYNILFRWLGKDFINGVHEEINLKTRVVHQLSEDAFSFPPEANNFSYSFELTDPISSKRLGDFGERQLSISSLSPMNQVKGLGHMDSTGKIVSEPFDFKAKNYVPLESLLGALERALKPILFPPKARYKWDSETYHQIASIMQMKPRDLPYPIDTLPDNYVKFFLFGSGKIKHIPPHITIRNKVGWAYGYLTEVAHIEDTKNDVEFFLAATIHVNQNQIYNDGVYEYEEVGLPFLDELGYLVYTYELNK